MISKSFLQILLALVLGPSFACAQDSHTYGSPYDALRATVLPVSRKCVESRIEIRERRLLFLKSFASTDCAHGISVVRGVWTTDSKFFIFNAQMTGGHQPWHWPIYFYSRRDNRVYNLDNYVGLIVAPDFDLIRQHIVETRVLQIGNDLGRPITADLDRIGRQRRR
jgi:hypothetical protein